MRADELRVLFLGCGDLGTGAAHGVCRAGFRVAIVELRVPLAVRRRVAFAEAARTGQVTVEGVTCRRVQVDRLNPTAEEHTVVLAVGPIEVAVHAFAPHAVVDARMTKCPLEVPLPEGVFRIALGPGHTAGEDCDAVVETLRGSDLGRVIWSGSGHPDTRVPGELGGETLRRLLRSPASGTLHVHARIGDRVQAGEIVAEVAGEPVRSAVAGMVRGLLADGDAVERDQKLGDVDPRTEPTPADRISDKSHQVGDGVLTALVQHFRIERPGTG
jgi:xanthine dehydrogenase accessory factor